MLFYSTLLPMAAALGPDGDQSGAAVAAGIIIKDWWEPCAANCAQNHLAFPSRPEAVSLWFHHSNSISASVEKLSIDPVCSRGPHIEVSCSLRVSQSLCQSPQCFADVRLPSTLVTHAPHVCRHHKTANKIRSLAADQEILSLSSLICCGYVPKWW